MVQADLSQRRKRSREEAGADHIRQALDEGKYQEQPGTRRSSVLDSTMVTRHKQWQRTLSGRRILRNFTIAFALTNLISVLRGGNQVSRDNGMDPPSLEALVQPSLSLPPLER